MKTQLVYQDVVHPGFAPEVQAMRNIGICVDSVACEDSERLIYRSFRMKNRKEYPADKRYVQGWEEYESMSLLSKYFPLIDDISIPTFFTEKLDDSIIPIIEKKGWDRVFIKNDCKSLWTKGVYASVWPDNSLDSIRTEFEKFSSPKIYVIRKFFPPELFIEEERYWVLNGKIYHRSGIIPEIVKEAAKRLNTLGSHYYTIDAVPGMIVEVNPGESSDRYGCNSPELFASWWKDAFDL